MMAESPGTSVSALAQARLAIEFRESERCDALLVQNLTTLDELLHVDLLHVHTSGMIENKEQYMTSLRSRLRFVAIDRIDYSVRLVSSNVAIATGRARQRVLVHATQQEVDLDVITTQVWVIEAGRWRQTQFHASRRT